MRYRLRTLLLLLAVGPPALAGAWRAYKVRPDAVAFACWLGAIALAVLIVLSFVKGGWPNGPA
jgi:hypothetical protein